MIIIEPANGAGKFLFFEKKKIKPASGFPILAKIMNKHVFYIINVLTLYGVEGMNS